MSALFELKDFVPEMSKAIELGMLFAGGGAFLA